MDLSELTSTPPTTQRQSILVSAEGEPLKINLQAVELEGRPKLVRILKGSGSTVVSNAKEAAIILVDSATESGKRLIRTWGHDARKVVLEHTWVRACINAGRPLLADDKWGGAMAIDDGKPVTIDGIVVDEDELEEVEALVTKSPLPTPRITPVDPTSQQSENTAEHLVVTQREPRLSISAPDAEISPPPELPAAHPIAVEASLSEERKLSVNAHNHIPPPLGVPPPASTQQIHYPRPTLPSQQSPSQSAYVYAPFPAQQPYLSSQSQIIPTQPFSHSSFSSSQQQILQPSNIPHTPLPSTQSQMQMTANSSVGQSSDFATLMTMMEVVRHIANQNQFPVSQQPINSNMSTFPVQPSATPGSAPSASSRVTGNFPYPETDNSVFVPQGHLSDTATSSWKGESGRDVSGDRSTTRKPRVKPSHRPVDEVLVPSISRKRPSAVKPAHLPSKRPRKGKEKAISTDSSEQSEADELVDDSEGSYSVQASTSTPERPRNAAARKKRGEIFLSESGQPLRFFVQVDLHGRHGVVTNIKKNMGKIVNSIADADYLILSPRSDTFQGLLNEAIALGKSPILAAFVADCVEEGALLDETDYVLESVAKIKALKRGRQSAFSIMVETSETLGQRVKTEKVKFSPAPGDDRKSKKVPKSMLSKPSTIEEMKDLTTSRSPTPPPPSTRQMMKNGKYLFTEAEDEYAFDLARHHLNRDPTISNTALTNKCHRKMPHHSTRSWATHIELKLKSRMEEIRKRANIAKRKRETEAANQKISNGFVATSIARGNGSTSNPTQPSQEELERQDFDVITQFFASGGGDDDNDERVWQELEKHCPCSSAISWPDYYAAHEKEVYTRIEELMNQRAGEQTLVA